jgi:hypothetical protein
MIGRLASLAAASLVATVLIVINVSCQEQIAITACKEIPAGGCPNRGNVCSDPVCVDAYTCTEDGHWLKVKSCPGGDAAPRELPDAGPGIDASAFDGASGGPGCVDLEAPDCSLAVATACGTGCCGCEDVYICAGGGWEYQFTCGADGGR